MTNQKLGIEVETMISDNKATERQIGVTNRDIKGQIVKCNRLLTKRKIAPDAICIYLVRKEIEPDTSDNYIV